MKKKYLSDLIPQSEYIQWLEGHKVVIKAPTGMGKTTFVLLYFLKVCKLRKKKVLILSNRKMLDMQYEFSLAEEYVRYIEKEEDLKLMTYQELSEQIKKCENIETLLRGFDVVICDEMHFFYADSDFNAFGTFVLLQVLVRATFFKTVLFITATYDEVAPLLQETYKRCAEKILEQESFPGIEKYFWADRVYDFSYMADFERFRCHWVPDMETLAKRIAVSEKKSVVFIDDKNVAEKFVNILKQSGIQSKEVFILNALVLEEKSESETIKMLVGAGKLLPKILVTTSVLDNGASIHDPEVGNLVLATESQLSFLQMIGRVRDESVESCDLYLFPRDKNYYAHRITQYEEKMDLFERVENILEKSKANELFFEGWYGTDEKTVFLRNAAAVMKREWNLFFPKFKWSYINYGDTILQENLFSKEKTGNMLLEYRRLYKLAMQGETKVAEFQMGWIKKRPEDLCISDSTYKEDLKREFINEALKIKGFELQKFCEAKVKIADRFQRELFPDILYKGKSLENRKFSDACERYGLCLKIMEGKDKKQRYSVEAIILEE